MPGIKHLFASPKSDGGDATLVQPGDWNDAHTWDITDLTEDDNFALIDDTIAYYDLSAGAMRRTKVRDLILPSAGRSWLVKDECFHMYTVTQGGMITTALNGTGATMAVIASTQSHPGILNFTTGTTATGRAGAFGSALGVSFGGGRTRFTSIIRIPTLSDATNRFTVWAGFGDLNTGNPVDGVFFRYIDNANTGKWLAVCRSNNVESTADGGVTVAAGTWYKLEAEVNAAGTSVSFFIDDAAAGTITTNIPTGVGRETGFLPALIVKSVGTTARTLDLDYYAYMGEFSTPRFAGPE